MRWFLLFILCILPQISHAAIVVSEVAWMGTTMSPDDEWIELHNTSNAGVSVDGWSLSDGNNLSIPLSGSIPSDAYAVLERTDDSTVPGNAFLIYKGALTNAGATLTLYRSDGSIEDQVVGGENWGNIGGDNASKNTAQLTESGWVTAPATPGYGLTNYTPPPDDQPQQDSTSSTDASVTKAGDDGKVIEMKLPNVSLQLQMQSLDSITVDQPISFAAVPQGLVPQIMDSLSYEWNFGDLATSSGNKVTHVFKSSGVYAVTVYAQYTRYQQIARKTITVLPVSLDLTYNRNGDLLIENNTAYEIDASNFILHGTTDIVFPPRTIILPHAVITVQKSKIPISQGAPIALFDPQKELVATAMKSVPARVTMAVTPTPRGSSPEIVSLSSDDLSAQKIAKDWSTSSNFLFTNTVSENGTGVQESTSSPRDLVKNEATTGIDVTGSHEGASTAAHMLPYVGLFGVIAAGLFAIFAARI